MSEKFQITRNRTDPRLTGKAGRRKPAELRGGRPQLDVIVALIVVMAAAAFFRIQFHNVAEYSRADELTYTNYATAIFSGGLSAYPTLIETYLNDPGVWLFPHPARWGYILLTGGWTRLLGNADTRALATLSTIAGILSVFLTYLIGVEFLSRRAALLAAALSVTSPLQLAMGRRALQEEVHCGLILLSFWLFVRLLKEDRNRQSMALLVLSILSLTATLAVKESTIFVLPMFLVTALLLRGWEGLFSRTAPVLILPFFLYIAGFAVLGGTLAQFYQIIQIVQGSGVLDNPYVPAYQSGPPHRVLIDFMTLAPVVCLIAVAGFGRLSAVPPQTQRPAVVLAAATATLLFVFCILPSKNIRNFTMGDPFIRLFAAWGANDYAERWREWGSTILVSVTILSGAVELWIFQTVFLKGGIYDPVTYQLLKALEMIPRS